MTTMPPDRWERIQASALEHLADDEVSALDYAADLQVDRDSYRLLAQTAIEHCYNLTLTCRKQSDTIIRLHQIIREYITAPSTARERRAA
jgi:hypothetical protein